MQVERSLEPAPPAGIHVFVPPASTSPFRFSDAVLFAGLFGSAFARFLLFFSEEEESLLEEKEESLLELESLELELESEEDASLRDFCVYALRVGSCGRNEVNRM